MSLWWYKIRVCINHTIKEVYCGMKNLDCWCTNICPVLANGKITEKP